MARKTYRVRVSEEALRELILAAIEAYAVPEPSHGRKHSRTQLETYGLLWGYFRESGEDSLFYIQDASVELHGERHPKRVSPSEHSFKLKRRCVDALFPHMGWIGTFHSHPYDDLEDVDRNTGYEFSDTDYESAEACAPEWWSLGYRVDLVTTICRLRRVSGRDWRKLRDNILSFDAGEFRIWMNASVIEPIDQSCSSFRATRDKRSPVWLEVPYVTVGAYAPKRLEA